MKLQITALLATIIMVLTGCVHAQNADGYTHLTWDKESTDQKIGTVNWDVMHGDVLYISPRLVDNGVGRPWPSGATFKMNYATPSMVYSNLWWTNTSCAVSATETGRVHALWGGTALDYYDGNMAYICRLGAWAGTTNIGHTIWWTMNMKASPGWAAGTAPVPSNLASNYVTRAEFLALSNYFSSATDANAVTNGGATITVDGTPYAISNGAVVAITSGSGSGISGTTCSNITAGIISTGVYVVATNALDIANAAVPKVATNGAEWGSHALLATGAQLSTATNAAIVDATGRVALVGYLLPVSTQNLVTATQLATATNGAVIAATARVATVGYLLPASTNASLIASTNLSQQQVNAHTNNTSNPHGTTPAQIGAASNTLAGMASAGALTGAVLTVGTGIPTWSSGLLSIPTNNFGGSGGGGDPNAVTNAQINSEARGSVTNKVAYLPVNVDPWLSYLLTNPISITANGTYLPWTSVLTPAPSAGTNLIVAANGQQPLLNCTGACVIGVDPNGGWGVAGINRFTLALWTTNWSVTIQSNSYTRWAAPLNLSVSRTNHIGFRGNGTNDWTIYPL